MRVLMYGAGVIGQIYGARLAQAGHTVTILARGSALTDLSERGVSLRRDGVAEQVRLAVVAEPAPGDSFDVAMVAVRRDQLDAALPGVRALRAKRVVFLLNHSLDLPDLREQVGGDRTVLAFPGVGGSRAADGTIDYIEVPQQPTTVGEQDGIEAPVLDLLRSAGFTVATADDMDSWLKTHAVFITAVGAAILACGGDSVALAGDRRKVATMVRAVGEGFRALQGQGVQVTPTPLRLIFMVVPRLISVPYWARQLRGPVGVVTIAPHMRATRHSEFPFLCTDVRRLVAGRPTPHLDRLLDAVA